jgi:hypothetical protein
METSFSIDYLGPNAAREMMRKHPAECLLFGTDSPWKDQAVSLQALRDLDLGPSLEAAVLSQNAERLLTG